MSQKHWSLRRLEIGGGAQEAHSVSITKSGLRLRESRLIADLLLRGATEAVWNEAWMVREDARGVPVQAATDPPLG